MRETVVSRPSAPGLRSDFRDVCYVAETHDITLTGLYLRGLALAALVVVFPLMLVTNAPLSFRRSVLML